MRNKKINIIFFADRLPPKVGGVETHADYFIKHFSNHPNFEIIATITKNHEGEDCLTSNGSESISSLSEFIKGLTTRINIIFFNSGRWIEELANIKKILPTAIFIYRTGGNEIIKAPLEKRQIGSHAERQHFWTYTINSSIDYLITNSKFTEGRLKNIGIDENLFIRCVGGVDIEYISRRLSLRKVKNEKRFICCSRFVPYKNHRLLIDAFSLLHARGIDFKLILVGDGPLKEEIQQKTLQLGLGYKVQFKGVCTIHQTLDELIDCDYYIQLSSSYRTEVEGGSYEHAEGMGRSILEAISTGTFVITTDTGALNEIIGPEEGILLATENPKKVSDSIEFVIANKRSSKTLNDKYSWSNYFLKYEKLFRTNA